MATRREKSQQSSRRAESASNNDHSEAAQHGSYGKTHRRFGWSALFVALLFGTVLEGLLGFKSPELTLDPIRREFWSLAHFHAASLALLNLVYVAWANDEALSETQQRSASRALLAGSALLPLGFFLGGTIHPEGDPGVGIFLVPIGALAILYAVAMHARAAWQS